jgi:hypothetical protein
MGYWLLRWRLCRIDGIVQHHWVHTHEIAIHAFRDDTKWEALRSENLSLYQYNKQDAEAKKVHFAKPHRDVLWCVCRPCLVGLVV